MSGGMARCLSLLLVATAVAQSCNTDECFASTQEDDALGLSLMQVQAKAARRMGRKILDELNQQQDDESGVEVEMYLPPDIHPQSQLLLEGSIASATSSNTSEAVFDCKRDYLLMYTIGKTGSSTFQASFGKLCGRYPRYLNSSKDENRKFESAKEVKTQTHGDQVAKDFLEKVPPWSNVWIVTIVRDPFPRMLSHFFQTMHTRLSRNRAEHIEMQELDSIFHSWFRAGVNQQGPQSDYFTFWQRFSQTTGIDILSKPFDFATKKLFISEQIEKRYQHTLVLRLEDADEWPTILAPHFAGFKLIADNVAEDKWYSDLYEQFKQQFVWTQSEFDELSSAKEMHFYSGDEIRQMKNSQHVNAD